MVLERYSHVMHLTSQVSGDLLSQGPDRRAAGHPPAGTVSGAPKVRAMEIIDELEPTKGPYAGVGRLRRLLGQRRHRHRHPNDGGRRWDRLVQAGAGIVADSDPDAEHDECWNKASASWPPSPQRAV